jgi:hypothetical protein
MAYDNGCRKAKPDATSIDTETKLYSFYDARLDVVGGEAWYWRSVLNGRRRGATIQTIASHSSLACS